jgi:hypothetical protein
VCVRLVPITTAYVFSVVSIEYEAFVQVLLTVVTYETTCEIVPIPSSIGAHKTLGEYSMVKNDSKTIVQSWLYAGLSLATAIAGVLEYGASEKVIILSITAFGIGLFIGSIGFFLWSKSQLQEFQIGKGNLRFFHIFMLFIGFVYIISLIFFDKSAWSIPIGFISGFFLMIAICFTAMKILKKDLPS